MSVICSNGSVTHTYGNVACEVVDYIKKLFGRDYFNATHISTKLAHSQLEQFRTNKEFWRLQKPLLIIRPRIEVDDNSKWFYGAAQMNRLFNVKTPFEYANRTDLLIDKERGVFLQFLWNRTKIYYDIIIIVDTYNEQLNITNHVSNLVIPNTPFWIKTALESYIPKNVVYPIADYLEIDKEKPSDILGYLNTEGNVPFTYKFKNGSGNDEFFSLYGTNIEAIPSELSIDDGNTNGLTTNSYTISFTLSCEFNMMGMYYLTLRDNSIRQIMCPPDKDINKGDTIVPLLTIPLVNGLKDLKEGWKIIHTPSYMTTDLKKDETDISAVIDKPIKEVLKYQRKMNLPQDIFIDFRVFAGTHELPYGKGFEIDLDDLDNPKLYTYICQPKLTYRLFVIINNSYIHSITTEITHFNQET